MSPTAVKHTLVLYAGQVYWFDPKFSTKQLAYHHLPMSSLFLLNVYGFCIRTYVGTKLGFCRRIYVTKFTLLFLQRFSSDGSLMGLDNPAFHDISYSIEEKESHDGFGGKNPDLIGKPPSADELIKIIHFEPPIDK